MNSALFVIFVIIFLLEKTTIQFIFQHYCIVVIISTESFC